MTPEEAEEFIRNCPEFSDNEVVLQAASRLRKLANAVCVVSKSLVEANAARLSKDKEITYRAEGDVSQTPLAIGDLFSPPVDVVEWGLWSWLSVGPYLIMFRKLPSGRLEFRFVSGPLKKDAEDKC